MNVDPPARGARPTFRGKFEFGRRDQGTIACLLLAAVLLLGARLGWMAYRGGGVSRFDELPQLWNVLRGDMRFVGPRPERPEFVASFSENLPYYNERHSVPPGLTGWAQLCYAYGSSEQDAVEKLKYDLYYIKNRSFLFDLAILIQTVEVIVFGKGAR